MPKYKCIQSVGVAHLLGSYALPNTDGRISTDQIVELSAEALEKVGAENFVAVEETETQVVATPTETTPEIQPEVTESKVEEQPSTETETQVVV